MQTFDFTPYDAKWKYVAVDEDGTRTLYQNKPIRFKWWWQSEYMKRGEYLTIDKVNPRGWENSLQEREKDLQD